MDYNSKQMLKLGLAIVIGIAVVGAMLMFILSR
ncbi:MAG: hypothetical protein TR69_WS6001001316 [candidate division WS6 bacterium OLB20]|uniref:Uncharacterized protein n=1 Tax=candidate division WS6 bacterium OLB20 TaxID=1617426 RepID=A0A136LWJ5_9BACT|nr:MAG: hypothetical protein TR69_WS6001001316 [candidate division WS6 bacterium OLB20]